MVEVNEVLYPIQLDTVMNFPDVTEVTEATGEEINRNRDAILTIERVLGRNPHIGLYTENPAVATVAERLDILENGIAEGRFAYRNLNVNNALVVTTDRLGTARVDVGGDAARTNVAPVYIRGPLRVLDSGMTNKQVEIGVPIKSTARGSIFQASSIAGEPIFRITDTNANPNFTDRIALHIDGNVLVSNGRLLAEFAVNHNQLLGVDTTPTPDVAAIHVTRGDYHSHVRRRDPVSGALLNEVDPNPSESTYGLIDHQDLLNIFTKNGQTGFAPVDGVAYHVTNGDDHDHRDGRGAKIDHAYLNNVDPAHSNHVTGGDSHAHTPAGDGGMISHHDLMDIGFLTHPEIDYFLNVEFQEHVNLIDPINSNDINEVYAGLGHHVPQGHVSDPSAHHTRYTDEEALSASVLISADTTVYEEGRNTATRSHIQAIGSGTVSANNPHGLAAADIGALEGFDAQGNLPDFTSQFLEAAVRDIIQDPSFGVLLAGDPAEITAVWTFKNSAGLIQLQKSTGPAIALEYDDVARFGDIIDHIDGSGTPPYHAAGDISNIPAGNIVATNVQDAIDELDAEKEPVLGGSNLVTTAKIDNGAVTEDKLANGAVTLAKMSNPYVIMPFTFVRQIGGTSSVVSSIWGVEMPALLSGAEIVQVTAMWRRASGSLPTLVHVDVGVEPSAGGGITWLESGNTGLTPTGPLDIRASLTEATAATITLANPLPSLSAADDLYVYMARSSAAASDMVDVTITIYVKMELVA